MRILVVLIALFAALFCSMVKAQDVLVTYQGTDALDILDRTNGSVLSTTTMTLTGVTISGTNGLTIDPTNGTIYVVIRSGGTTGGGTRELCTVDRTTGVCTSLGTLAERVASIAFDGTGTLYAVTGDGATTSETLFTVNLTTAALTSFVTLGNGDDGEAIAFNPDDGLMYHLSGNNAPVAYETINLTTTAVTPITNSIPGSEEYSAFYYDASGTFLATDINGNYESITTTATTGALGTFSSGYAKGLVILLLC